MSYEVIINVIVSLISGIFGYLLSIGKIKAETKKLEAEAEKTRMEAAKLKAELDDKSRSEEIMLLRPEHSDQATLDSENLPKYLFGYFFIKEDGLEKKILRFNNPIPSSLMGGEIRGNAIIGEEIDAIMLQAADKNGIAQSELLKAGLSHPIYYRLFKQKSGVVHPTPYILFKVGLQREVSGCNCEWQDKAIITPEWCDENQTFPLQLPNAEDIGNVFKKDFYCQQLELMILECVDVLVFRKNVEHNIEFLLIHRNRKGEIKIGPRDTWEYPKGGMKYYETHLEAAYRELREETSITFEEIRYAGYLGWQTVDVSKRKKPYNTIRVHGFTFYYTGNPSKHMVYDQKEGHDDFKWMPIEQAKQAVWMEEASYAEEFFRRWVKNEDEILHRAGIKKKKYSF